MGWTPKSYANCEPAPSLILNWHQDTRDLQGFQVYCLPSVKRICLSSFVLQHLDFGSPSWNLAATAMSAFTALNGGSPKANEPPADSSERAFSSDERLPAPGKNYRHKSPETHPSRNDTWKGHTTDRQPLPTIKYPEGEGPHKRKRSGSAELRRDSRAHERTPEETPSASNNESREAYGTPQRESRHYSDDQREKDTAWKSQEPSREERNGYDSQQNSATSPRGQTEEQIGDALRRATSQVDHSDYGNTSPDAEDRPGGTYGSPYGTEHRSDSIIQHDPKKRKRNFSNRTKTGCLTCRKRKKKCDEQKPECKGHILMTNAPFPSVSPPSTNVSGHRRTNKETQAAIASGGDFFARDTHHSGEPDGQNKMPKHLLCLSSRKTRLMFLLERTACRSMVRMGRSPANANHYPVIVARSFA